MVRRFFFNQSSRLPLLLFHSLLLLLLRNLAMVRRHSQKARMYMPYGRPPSSQVQASPLLAQDYTFSGLPSVVLGAGPMRGAVAPANLANAYTATSMTAGLASHAAQQVGPLGQPAPTVRFDDTVIHPSMGITASAQAPHSAQHVDEDWATPSRPVPSMSGMQPHTAALFAMRAHRANNRCYPCQYIQRQTLHHIATRRP